MKDMNEKEDKVGIPVKYVIPDEIVTQYATDMVIQQRSRILGLHGIKWVI